MIDAQQLQLEVSKSLRDLDVLADLVDALLEPHRAESRGVGFLTPAARRAQDQLLRTERAARVDGTTRPVGLGWMRGTPATTGTGHITAAATVTAASAAADIWSTVAHCSLRIIRALDRAGVCAVHRLPAEPTVGDRINHLRELVWAAPSVTLLASVQRDLDAVLETARIAVDGPDRAGLPDPCPWCGLHTLVAYFADGVVRCDRDPRTGHYGICRCTDPYCACKQKPVTHRHEWYRDRGAKPNGWWALFDHIARNSSQENA